MSAHADSSLSLPTRRRTFLVRLVTAVHAWRTRMRQRRELLTLNDIELRDLSLTEADVNREARKSFWETVELTGRGCTDRDRMSALPPIATAKADMKAGTPPGKTTCAPRPVYGARHRPSDASRSKSDAKVARVAGSFS